MAGSIAGAASSPNSTVEASASFFNGAAPGAKLVVDDCDDFTGLGSGPSIPSDVYSDLLPHSYSAGAKLYSNSWNFNSFSYSQRSYDMDLFQRQHDDFLILLGSGNEHGSDMGRPYRIKAPGNAKNVVTVGAADNSRESWSAHGLAAMMLDAGAARLQAAAVFPAAFGTSFGSMITLPLVSWASMICSYSLEYEQSMDFSGTVVLIQRNLIDEGYCPLSRMVYYAQKMKAAACLIYDQTGDGEVVPQDEGWWYEDVTIPSGMISLSDGKALINATLFGPVNVTIRLATKWEGSHLSVRTLADFSARGPTEDQRIKPDVLCPGHMVTSASSDGSSTTNQVIRPTVPFLPAALSGSILPTSSQFWFSLHLKKNRHSDFLWRCWQCGGATETMSGTSGATALCAGSAALIREYFRRSLSLSSSHKHLILVED